MASSQRVSMNKSASEDISRQTLSQPLNPGAFLPGALRGFPKNRAQVADTRNRRNYPQLSNESLKRRASTFMAAPNMEILAQMRKEGVEKDFDIEECKSSFEYLGCLMGFGIHQTLNFPIMGVFYLELVKLVMTHMDRFSSDEKVRLIQVRNVCENILRRNSIREEFLPVDIMDEIVERAIEEEDCAQIRDFSDDEEDMSEDDYRGDMSDDDMGMSNGSKEKEDMEMSDEEGINEKSNPVSDISNSINKKLNKFSGLSISKSSSSDDKVQNILSKVSVTKSKIEEKSEKVTSKNPSDITTVSKSTSNDDSDDDEDNLSSENDDLQNLDKQLKEIDNQIASGYSGVKKPVEKTNDDLVTLDDFSDSEDEESVKPLEKKISETKKVVSDDVPLEDDGDLFSDSDDEPSDELIQNSSVSKEKASPPSTAPEMDDFDSDDEFTGKSSTKKGSDGLGIPSPPKGQSKISNLVSDIRNLLGEDQKNQAEGGASKGAKAEGGASKGAKASELTLDSDSDGDLEEEMPSGKEKQVYNWNDF